YQPQTLAEQVIVLYAATQGKFDDIAVIELKDLCTDLVAWVEENRAEIIHLINTEKVLTDDIKAKLDAAVSDFLTENTSSADDEEEYEDDEELDEDEEYEDEEEDEEEEEDEK